MKVVNERLCAIDDFDPVSEVQRLRALKRHEYATSVFSSTSASECSFNSTRSKISEHMAEAEAELAVKQTEYELLQEEQKQLAKLAELELEQKRALEAQHSKLRQLEARKKLEIAHARFNAYKQMSQNEHNENTSDGNKNILRDIAVKQEPKVDFKTQNTKPLNERLKLNVPNVENNEIFVKSTSSTSNSSQDTNMLAKVFAESVSLSRLPVPEPSTFTGDPLQYIEWRTSFDMLIERKGVPASEKIFYLKKYLGGSARKALEAFFYCNTESAYDKAKTILDERYGHPFILQKAFRDKLDRWPKIAAKDPMALSDFADFLQGCKDATPHVPSLDILNDCTENRKLISKLPDWAAVRWNREVTHNLETSTYPSFDKFVQFVVKEAKVACNPVSSLYALNDSEHKVQRDKTNSHSSSKVRVLATSTQNSIRNTTNTTDYKHKQCDYCKRDGHSIFKCDRFLSMTIEQKRSFIREHKLCFGCLRQGHLNKDCQRKHTCATCQGKHPTCLHEERNPVKQQTTERNSTPNVEVKSVNSCRVSLNSVQSTSMIVPVWVSHKDNSSREILTYALLDIQSDTTFILDDTAAALQVQMQPIKLSLSTMTSQHSIIDSSRVNGLQVRGFKESEKVSINQAYTRNFIPAERSHIPVKDTVKDWPHLQEVVDDLPPLQSCEVGLLIGYNCPQSLAPRKLIMGRDDEPYAVQTLLGWSVVGYSSSVLDDSTVTGIIHRTAVKELPVCSPRDLINVLESDFAHDHNQSKKVSQEDVNFLSIMDKTIRQRDDKHLEMPLPFKERPILPNNKPLALLRLNHLKRKLNNDQNYFEHYKQYMHEILERCDAEPVESGAADGNLWYIPHHGVYHPKKPDKLRVVFDCSTKYRNSSLNQHLLTGPDLTNALTGVLCRFRRYPIAIMCDIKKMFHQFFVSEPDRNFLRFLWWENGNLNSEPKEYRMRKHLFGAASSPGCANYGLKHLAKAHENESSIASYFVQNDFYVDDGLTSVETEREAIKLVSDAQSLCTNGGLRLHKFISNSVNVICSIPLSERASDVKNLNLALEQLPVERALGVQWCVEEDVFSFQISIKDSLPTRRNMLSIVESIFDPLGFLCPFTFKGKRMLQEMCQNGIGWDDPLPADACPEWQSWIGDISNLQFIKIPRCLKPLNYGIPDFIELHHFSDASNLGYGQCTYIRFISENEVHCSLLTAKARVAPQKVVTIPRLELTAAVLSVKMSVFLKEELNLNIDKEYFWTDSQVVLGYINNEARRFHVFVANRIQLIRECTTPNQWFYVASENNPADYASRGLDALEIMNTTWLKGQSFLWQKVIESPSIGTELQLGDPEVKAVHVVKSLCT